MSEYEAYWLTEFPGIDNYACTKKELWVNQIMIIFTSFKVLYKQWL